VAEPQVLRVTLCYLQVCVPSRWTDTEVESWANRQRPTGISSKWKVTIHKSREGKKWPRYVRCESHPGHAKHVVLVC
jgi:hypothetical protein